MKVSLIEGQRKRQIDELASSTARLFEFRSPPVDVMRIAQEEGIILRPSNYDGAFDSRLEYHSRSGKFLLFLDNALRGTTEGRRRFSVAHELGHYYLPEHRKSLLAGRCHYSHTGFRTHQIREREADLFAARLLLPGYLFDRRVPTLCNLNNIRDIADAFRASLTCTAIRFTELTGDPCCAVLHDGNRILFSSFSEELAYSRVGKLVRSKGTPTSGPTRRVLNGEAGGDGEVVDGSVEACVWFSWGKDREVWEEAIRLGNFGLVLTMLYLNEP